MYNFKALQDRDYIIGIIGSRMDEWLERRTGDPNVAGSRLAKNHANTSACDLGQVTLPQFASPHPGVKWVPV